GRTRAAAAGAGAGSPESVRTRAARCRPVAERPPGPCRSTTPSLFPVSRPRACELPQPPPVSVLHPLVYAQGVRRNRVVIRRGDLPAHAEHALRGGNVQRLPRSGHRGSVEVPRSPDGSGPLRYTVRARREALHLDAIGRCPKPSDHFLCEAP